MVLEHVHGFVTTTRPTSTQQRRSWSSKVVLLDQQQPNHNYDSASEGSPGSSSSTPSATTEQKQQQAPLSTVNGLDAGTALPTSLNDTDHDLTMLAIDPRVIEIVQIDPEIVITETDAASANGASHTDDASSSSSSSRHGNKMISGPAFVNMFRGSANYIANHRNTIVVYHIPGGLLDLPQDPTGSIFRDLMNDVALTWLLGMKLILVAGCRHQIDKRLPGRLFQHPRGSLGLTVTDEAMLRIVKEEAGYVRFEIERQLARSLRLHSSGASTNHHAAAASTALEKATGNVVSGNFYSAQPFGILDGVDYQYTGYVRKPETEKILQVLANRDICLLTTLGVSPSGEVFNVNSECLAATVAGTMGASKIIFFTEQEMQLRHRVHQTHIQNLRVTDAKHLLDYYHVKMHKRGFVTVGSPANSTDLKTDEFTSIRDAALDEVIQQTSKLELLYKIGWSVQALQAGVKRAHIISPQHGALLQELFTRDGSGTLISGDLYEGIRRANVNDVSGIYDLIQPLVLMGKLVPRPKATLEKDIDSYYVYTRDNLIVACGQLKLYDPGYAEIGCLVVHKDYRQSGRGDAMLGYLERLCLQWDATNVFVLSTQTMEWFVERDFERVGVESLPPSRQATYNWERASSIYMKKIEGARDLDASELWWSR